MLTSEINTKISQLRAQREIHTYEVFMEKYHTWVTALPSTPYRTDTWDDYCDVRDSYPIGTNREITALKSKLKDH